MKFIWSSKSALFIVLILITGLCFGQSKGNQPKSNKNQNSSTDRSDTTVVITQQTPPAPQEQPTQQDLKRPFDFWEWARTSSPTDILSLALAAIVVAITAQTLFFLKQQVVAATDATIAANRSADAARDSAITAAQQLELATSPKLSVDDVRTANFYVGMEPVFFVKVVNAGPVAAESVKVSIRVESATVGGSKYTSDAQVMLLPANSSREYPIRWPRQLTREDIDAFNSGSLEVKGEYEHNGESKPYCYKYYPWKEGPRPSGVPEFIDCKFNPRLTLLLPTGRAELA